MKSQSVFISGATQGIGLALARRFYREGWKVMICARGKANLEKAAAEMPGLLTYACDLTVKDEVLRMANEIRERLGVPDVLINNGGLFLPGSIGEEEDGVLEQLFSLNVASAYHLTRALLPGFTARKSGTIVNMCSVASLRAYPNGGSYCITKFAMLGFSKVLREELKPHDIRVISVMPGAVYTASWDGSGIPESRMMPAEDVAEIIWTGVALSSRTVMEEIVLRPMKGDI